MIFDGGVSIKSRPATIESFEIDDSEQGPLLGGNSHPAHAPAAPLISHRSIITLITFPFNLLSNLFRFIFGVLHIPFPRSFNSINFITSRRRPSPSNHFTGDPKSVVDRWVRSLEEETGAVCASRVGSESESTAVAGPSFASTSTIRNRGDAYGNGRVLPDFFLGGYEEAMRACQRDLRIGCIIIVSEEHEDVGEFKRCVYRSDRYLVSHYRAGRL
jgi:FAS-associated factor 2